MKTSIPFVIVSLLLMVSCGIPSMVKNTIETSDGSKITVNVSEPKPTRGLTNPVAHMLVVFSTAPVTLRRTAFIEAAEQHSGCKAIKETFVFQGSTNGVAAVELDCD